MADDTEIITQNEIEELLRQAQAAARGEPLPAGPTATAAPSTMGQNEIEAMLAQGSAAKTASAKASASSASAVDQSEIEAMLKSSTATKTAAPPPGKPTPMPSKAAPTRTVTDDISYLLAQAEEALASVDQPMAAKLEGLAPFNLNDFSGSPASAEKATLELLRDVELDVKIELGRTHMHLEEVLKLKKGAVVPLDKLAGDPVDVYVNGRLVARGEVLVLNDNFCIRIAELLAGEEAKAA